MEANRAERLDRLVTRFTQGSSGGLNDISPAKVVLLAPYADALGWEDAYQLIASALRLPISPSQSIPETIRRYLASKGTLGSRLFWQAYSGIVSAQPPPLSYHHLANLAANRRIDLILTTSWDPLLETAFSQILPPNEYRILTWGDQSSQEVARSISQRGIPQIIKVNGDLRTELVPPSPPRRPHFCSVRVVVTALRNALANGVVIAHGPKDRSVDPAYESVLAMCAEVAELVVEFDPIIDSRAYSEWLKLHSRISVEQVSDFDIFMIELDRRVELSELKASRTNSAIQDQIIQSLELGAASIPFAAVTAYVHEFTQSLVKARIDWIAYIDDPIAPGGTEIWRRLARTPLGQLPHLRVPIITSNNNRLIQRHAEVPSEAVTIPPGARVAVVDSASFSGNTLQMATEALAVRFPGIRPIPAVLVASKSLVERSQRGEEWLRDLIYRRVTERHDIAFPWGITFSTDRVARRLDYGVHARVVEVFRRPWGSGEVFATSENCSVRLLTIDAAQKLSFQRHICRDEFFVALDDGVGIDISTHDFESAAPGEFDSRIEPLSLEEGDYLFVPRGIWHRVRATRTRVRVLEIAFGIYDEEFDIERLLDLYGRAPKSG